MADLVAAANNADVLPDALLCSVDERARVVTGATPGERALLTSLAVHRWRRGDAASAALIDTATTAWGDGRLLSGQGPEAPFCGWLIAVLAACDALDRAPLRLVQGRIAEARADALSVLERIDPRGARGLVSVSRIIATHACLRGGDLAAARRLIDQELDEARRLGPPSAVGIALRAKGRLEGSDAGLNLLDESATILEAVPRPLQLAHSLVELGAALRRARRAVDAREPLRRGSIWRVSPGDPAD